jgi:hypothetical protein
MSVMSVCVLTRVERPGVSFATCDRASEVLAMALRSERKENILIVDEEAGDEVVEMEGLRFMPACWYLHVGHNQNKMKKHHRRRKDRPHMISLTAYCQAVSLNCAFRSFLMMCWMDSLWLAKSFC